MGNRGYLQCRPREQAKNIWWQCLNEQGYFTDVPCEEVDVIGALGRITACSVYARQSVPHYNGAAMDGYAVRATDTFGASEKTPIRLKVIPNQSDFSAGGCFVVDTGDVMPSGTDAVIMIEDVHGDDGYIEIIAAASPWQHVRIIGEDLVVNEMVLPEYHQITPPDIAALLAAGLDAISVVRRPIVTVIPTGSELVNASRELQPGKILDVNSYMLCAAVTDWGGEAKRHPIVADEYEAIRQAVADSLADSDIVVTNAGTAAGTEDFTARVLTGLGKVLVHGVAIKPGKPVILAVCQGKPVIGLPGYPVSALLAADLFLREVLRARGKYTQRKPKTVKARMAKQVYSNMGVDEYVRVSLGEVQGKMVAAPLGRGAGLLTSLTKAQGIVTVGAPFDGLSAGAVVDVTLLGNRPLGETLLAVGSHDLALDVLGVHIKRHSGVGLSCANVGSMGGIMAIRNDEAHLSGVHILDETTGEYNTAAVHKYLVNKRWQLIHLAMREQGLMVASGNPKQIAGLQDLAKQDVRFINRQRGSGTRMLLDFELARAGMASTLIQGYEQEVGTHMAVAACVAGGSVDVGMGIRAAAQALGLEFIPIAWERYDVIFNFLPDDLRARQIIQILQSQEFRQEIEQLGGYDLRDAGMVVASSGGEVEI